MRRYSRLLAIGCSARYDLKMRECFVDVAVRRDAAGRQVTVTKTCKEYIRELENALAQALHTLRSHNLSSTDSAPSPAASILTPSEQCRRFFLIPAVSWNNDGTVNHPERTEVCVREKNHPTREEDGIGCLSIQGWTERK